MNRYSSVETLLDDIKTGERTLTRDKLGGSLSIGQAVSGIKAARAWFGLSCGTVGTSDCNAQGKRLKQRPCEAKSTEVQPRGGRARTSDEAAVTAVEQRGSIIQLRSTVNWVTRRSR